MATGLDPVPAATVAAHEPARTESYVDWPAIIAGAVLASAISVIMLAFGSALGLSFVSPFENTGASAVVLGIALGAWLVWVQVSSFMAGGYVTGRLRRRMHDATEHESDVRDGVHGLLVWATGVVFGGLMLAIGVGGLIGGTASAIGGAAGTAAAQVAPLVEDSDPLGYVVDTAFRDGQATETRQDSRAEATAIVGRGILDGEIVEEDRNYLAVVVARETGVSEEEARARVDTMIARAEAAATEAQEMADRARRFSVITAFITAASLAISAAGAYWAAGMGGRHRDEGTVVDVWFDRLR